MYQFKFKFLVKRGAHIMIDFVSYLAGVPAGEKNNHKREVLTNFAQCVLARGDTATMHLGKTMIPAKVAFIQGWVHQTSPTTPHLMIRRNVIDYQKKHNNRTLVVDSNLFNYTDGNRNKSYARFSFDGVFPNTGNYFWDNPDPARWAKISAQLGITLKDYRNKGKHILICTQRNGGWSMKNLNVVEWLNQTIEEIRRYTDRPIVVRPHPGDRAARSYLSQSDPRYTLSTNQFLTQDLHKSHAVITYNSSPGVAAAIEGYPVFVTDPEPEYSQAFPIANTDFANLEQPNMPDRKLWIEKLSMCHWNREEIRSGEAWDHIKKFI